MNLPTMKSKYLLLALLSAFIVSCNVHRPEHLPSFHKYASSPYGCNISLKLKNEKKVSGELIYSDKDFCYVKCGSKKDRKTGVLLCEGVLKIGFNEVDKGYITLYNSKLKMSTMPILTVLSVGHGLLGIGSLPINITGAIVGMTHSVKHGKLSQINRASLVAYSRFPNGIPEGVDIFTL